MKLKWTHTIPTVEGFYFKRFEGSGMCVRLIVKRDDGWRVCESTRNEYGTDLKLYKPELTEWAGPIPEPE